MAAPTPLGVGAGVAGAGFSAAEALPGFELAVWVGLFAPAGTPAPAVTRLSQEVAASLRAPRLRERIVELGSEPVGSTAEEFAAFHAAELPKVAELVRLSGATVE